MSEKLDPHAQNVQYSQDEICPACGNYSPDGDVCPQCLKAFGLYKPKITYNEDM